MALKGLYVEQAGTQSLNNFPVAYKPGTAEWSQSAWVWLDTPVASNRGMGIAGLHNDLDTGTSERTLAIYQRSHGPVLLSYTFDSGIRHNETVTTVPIGRWCHVGVSAVANGRHVLWIDGKPSRYATGGGFFTGYGTVRVSLNGTQIGSGTSNAQSPRQRIADVAMWDVALSDEDMLALATKQARPTQIQYGRCFAYFPLSRSLINLRSPERGSPNLTELANFRLDQQSPFEGLPGLNLYGALGLSARRVAPAGGASNATVNLAGQSGTGTLGTLSIQASSSLALVGQSGTGTLGTLTLQASASPALTGQVGTGTLGTLGLQRSSALALVGQSGTGTLGTLGLQASSSVTLTGQSGTGSVGTLNVISGTIVALTGQSGTGTLGALSLQASSSLALSGVTGTGAVGSLGISLGTVSVSLTGQLASMSVGTITVQIGSNWTQLTPSAATWAATSGSSALWSPVTPSGGTWSVN